MSRTHYIPHLLDKSKMGISKGTKSKAWLAGELEQARMLAKQVAQNKIKKSEAEKRLRDITSRTLAACANKLGKLIKEAKQQNALCNSQAEE